MVADAVLDCSRRGDIILDSYAGSGTTLIAAEQTGRRGYGIELDPYYVDTILLRFDDVYGLKATHVGTELDFAGVKAARQKDPAK